MSKILDFVLNLLKWPVAIFLLLSLPGLFESYNHFNFNNLKFHLFFIGAGFYLFTIIITGYNICHSMQIISHELTHIVFACLSFHSAGRVRINPDGSGGSMLLEGRGNWLITLSPYFFPLFSVLYMLLMPNLLKITDNNWLVYAIFGYLFGYYAMTVLSQVHPGQTDIIREGYLSSAIIIIGANLYTVGIIFAFNSQLWEGVDKYLRLVMNFNLERYLLLENLIRQYI